MMTDLFKSNSFAAKKIPVPMNIPQYHIKKDERDKTPSMLLKKYNQMFRGFLGRTEMKMEEARRKYSWPSWCRVPMEVGVDVAGDYDIRDYEFTAGIGATISVLSNWENSKVSLIFDEDMRESLCRGSLEDFPVDILFKLPYPCVYIDYYCTDYYNSSIMGFFASLDYDRNSGTKYLILLFVTDDLEVIPHMVYLHGKNYSDGQERTRKTLAYYLMDTDKYDRCISNNFIEADYFVEEYEQMSSCTILKEAIQLLLYLCSKNAEIKPYRPSKPGKTKGVKSGACEVNKMIVGEEIGKRIRSFMKDNEALDGIKQHNGHRSHRSPIPHLRRAHAHRYWTGKNRTQLEYRWLDCIAVNDKGAVSEVEVHVK